MLGCEIIEAAEAGDLVLWSKSYALKVLRDHSADVAEFESEISPSWKDGKVAAATLLTWLGY